MIWLTSAADRAYKYAHRKLPVFTGEQRVAVEIVLECVHPGNLGPLPPSPSDLLYKARQLGLIK